MSLRARVFAIALTVLAVSSAHAQDAAFEKLVGTWKGKVDLTDEPERTLVVKSVSREGDVWIATVEFGPTGKPLSLLPARVEKHGGGTMLSFPISATRKVELSLVSERELRGSLKVSAEGSWVVRKMVLTKTSDKP